MRSPARPRPISATNVPPALTREMRTTAIPAIQSVRRPAPSRRKPPLCSPITRSMTHCSGNGWASCASGSTTAPAPPGDKGSPGRGPGGGGGGGGRRAGPRPAGEQCEPVTAHEAADELRRGGAHGSAGDREGAGGPGAGAALGQLAEDLGRDRRPAVLGGLEGRL